MSHVLVRYDDMGVNDVIGPFESEELAEAHERDNPSRGSLAFTMVLSEPVETVEGTCKEINRCEG